MTFEQMTLILAGKSAKVAAEVEKAIKPYVSGSQIYRQK